MQTAPAIQATAVHGSASHADDLVFARRLVRKDERAWADFFLNFRGFCQSITYRYNRGNEFDDLFSMLVLKLLGTRGGPLGALVKYDGSASLKTYVYFVFKHLILNHIRDTQTRSVTVETETPIEQLATAAPVDCGREDEDALLAQAVTSLDARDRRLLELYYYQELTVRQIGTLLGCDASTVSRHLKRIQEALRAVLEPAATIPVNPCISSEG